MTAVSSWVSKTPQRAGGQACIRETRIPVWAVVNLRRLGASEDAILRAYPSLSAADLAAAFAYNEANRDEIDDAIRENEQGGEGLVG